jgi:hypothetical protein
MKSLLAVVLTALGTYAAVWLLGAAAMRFSGVPKGFPPFTALPLFSGLCGGFLGAWIIYAFIRRFDEQPDRTFFFVSIAILALSFLLPLRLSFTKSVRFAGVTPAAQMMLALMHTVIAAAAVSVLTRTKGLQ